MKRTLKALLADRADKLGDKTFLFWEDEEISYAKLYSVARAIASSLCLRGIEKNDKVCVWSYNRPEYAYINFGCAFAGAVLVPINTQFKEKEAEYIIRNSEAKVLVTEPRFMGLVEKIRPYCPGLERVIVFDDSFPDCERFMDLYNPEEMVEREIEEDDVAGIIYTSGTTGHPKGVVLTHSNYVFNSWELTEAAKMNEDDRFMCILPLFHVNGQVVTLYAPMYAGGSMVLLSRFSPKDFLPKLERYKATAFSGVPTVYAILNNLPDAEDYNLSRLRFCLCGAAPMPVEVFETFERKYHAYILEGYGLSEATCASSLNPLDGARKIGSIGLPISGQEMKVVDDEGLEVPTGSIGEIVVKGDNVMREYYRDEAATAETLRDGWLHTGDLARRDKDGYFFIVGRKKEMIIRGGENIYPREIEDVLATHPSVRDVAVVGIPDKIWGEEVAAFVVNSDGSTMKETEVMEYCKDKLANYKCPRMVFFWDSLPKTANGKIRKNLIVDEYVSQRKG